LPVDRSRACENLPVLEAPDEWRDALDQNAASDTRCGLCGLEKLGISQRGPIDTAGTLQ